MESKLIYGEDYGQIYGIKNPNTGTISLKVEVVGKEPSSIPIPLTAIDSVIKFLEESKGE